MNLRNLVPISYALTIAFISCAILTKVMQIDAYKSFTLLMGSVITQILFAIFSILEIRNSEKITKSEKSRWTTFLMISPPIFGMIYLTSLRRRIRLY
jgi:hypothetical protein